MCVCVSLSERACVYVYVCVYIVYYSIMCWSLPSNQSFYRQIAGYMRGMRDPRIGQ